MLILKIIVVCFVALIFAMPIMFPNVKIRAYQSKEKK